MGFDTPFLAENQFDGLDNFGFYKIQRHTKTVIVSMLQNFFSSLNSTYKIQMPDIIGMQGKYDVDNVKTTSTDTVKVYIEKDFPYGARKLPLILVSLKSATEKKMYIGADNFSYYDIRETSTGRKTATKVYHGAATMSLGLIILSQSHEERMKFADLINMCFTHYYRWHYFYTLGDGNTFSIMPSMDALEFGAETEITNESMMAVVYITDITMRSFIEYSFRDLLTYPTVQQLNIDANSGVAEDGITGR